MGDFRVVAAPGRLQDARTIGAHGFGADAQLFADHRDRRAPRDRFDPGEAAVKHLSGLGRRKE